MSWQPEDWIEIGGEPNEDRRAQPEHHRVALTLLDGLPVGPESRVAELRSGAETPAAEGLARFERLDRVELGAVGTRRGRYELVVALDSLAGLPRVDLNGVFRRVFASLVDGGIFVATILASDRDASPYLLWPAPDRRDEAGAGLHEFELQYRLRRAGFLGARLHRFRRVRGAHDALLCMASRRGWN